MSTARKILSNTAFQIAGRMSTALMSVVTLKVITNYLSQAKYGEYVAVYEFLALFAIAADFGLFTIAVREMAKGEEKISKIIGNTLSIRLLLALVVLTAATVTAHLIPKNAGTQIPTGVMVGAFASLMALMNGTICSVLQVKLKMMYASLAQIIGKIIQVAYIIVVAFFLFQDNLEAGFYHLFVAGILANGVMFLISLYFVRKITTIRLRFDFQFWRDVILKAFPYGLALILSMIYFRIDSLMILYLKGKEEVALYGVAVRILEAFAILPLYFMNSTLPSLTRTMREKSDKYKQIIQYSFDFLAAVSMPILAGGFVVAYSIIFIISKPEYLSRLGDGFYGSDIALQMLLFATVFSFLNTVFSFTLIAMNKQGKILWINGTCALLNVILNYLLIPIYGFRGAAVTTVVCEIFILLAAWAMARRYLVFHVSFKNVGKIVFSAVVMAVVVHLLKAPTFNFLNMQNLNLFLLIAIGGVVYAGMLFLTGAVTKDMLKMLRRGENEREATDTKAI